MLQMLSCLQTST